ncbi:MAG: hemerythrin domain-containing protein [Trebonia sp.]
MADVFTVLATDHQEVKNMLAKLEKGPTRATGTSEDQLALRKKMTQELIIEESRREALEEMYFWPAVRDHLPADNALADEAIGQEQEAKQVLADLEKLDTSDAEFEKLLAKVPGTEDEDRHGDGPSIVLGARRPPIVGPVATAPKAQKVHDEDRARWPPGGKDGRDRMLRARRLAGNCTARTVSNAQARRSGMRR